VRKTLTFWKYSEVSPIDVPVAVPLMLVAVAVTVSPACGTGLTQVKLTSPSPLACQREAPKQVGTEAAGDLPEDYYSANRRLMSPLDACTESRKVTSGN